LLLLILAIAIALGTGYATVGCIWPIQTRGTAAFHFRVWLSLGLGLGLCSSLYYVLMCMLGKVPPEALLSVELTLCAFTYLCYRRRRTTTCGLTPARDTALSKPVWLFLLAAFVVVVTSALCYLVAYSLENPHGVWDAWAHWNSHARYMYYAGSTWIQQYAYGAHPDYPLLLPGLVSRLWTYTRTTSTSIPIVVALTFTACSVALLTATVSLLRGRTLGLVAGAILGSSYWFLTLGADQMADVPLAFYILATMSLLRVYMALPEDDAAPLALAGLYAGLAAWTKDEGLLFALAVPFAGGIIFLRRTGPKQFAIAMSSLILGLLPPLLMVSIFKIGVAPISPYLAQSTATVTHKLCDFARWQQLSSVYGQAIWGFFRPQLIVAVALPFIIDFRRWDDSALLSSILFLTLIGCSTVLIISPSAVTDQGPLVAWRLLMQVWPAFLLMTFTSFDVTPQSSQTNTSRSISHNQ
jgi:hypothetical protein